MSYPIVGSKRKSSNDSITSLSLSHTPSLPLFLSLSLLLHYKADSYLGAEIVETRESQTEWKTREKKFSHLYRPRNIFPRFFSSDSYRSPLSTVAKAWRIEERNWPHLSSRCIDGETDILLLTRVLEPGGSTTRKHTLRLVHSTTRSKRPEIRVRAGHSISLPPLLARQKLNFSLYSKDFV